MPYKPLSLPRGLNRELESIVRERVDPFLSDVHNMFRLPYEEDPNGEGGCNFPIATTLVGVLAGVTSVPNIDTRGRSGSLFKTLVNDHYPADPSGAGAIDKNKLADALWDLYRCPLEHSLGSFDDDTRKNVEKIFGVGTITDLSVDKGRLTEDVIRGIEEKADKTVGMNVPMPLEFGPTLRIEGTHLRLTARVFYWGVRQAVIKWAEAQIQQTSTSQQINLALGPTEVSSGSTSNIATPNAPRSWVERGSTGPIYK